MSVASQKRRKILIAAVSAVGAVGAFAYAVTQSRTPSTPAVVAGTTGGTAVSGAAGPVQVLSVTTAMKKGVDTFSATNTAITSVAAASAPADRVDNEAAVDGQVATRDLAAGDVVVKADLGGYHLAVGSVSMNVAYDSTKYPAGYISAGDSLNVLTADGKGGVTFGLQNVRVLKVNSTGAASAGSSLVVEVTQQQALVLFYLNQSSTATTSAILQFVVRSPGDSTTTNTTVNSGNLGSLLGSK